VSGFLWHHVYYNGCSLDREDRVNPLRVTVIVVCAFLATGCDKSSPVAPGPAAPTVTELVVTGADAVLTGASTSYTATAKSSDGTTRTVMPTWTTSNASVATVDSTGRLDGRSHGSTDLTASYAGRDVSKSVQVVSNYAGEWQGRYVIRTCADSGDLTDHDGGWCQSQDRVGTVRSLTLLLSQTGSDLTEIDGTMFENRITGVVTADGRLNLAGTFLIWDFDHEMVMATVQIGPWDTNLSSPGVMIGHWLENLASLVGRIGSARTDKELVTMTRTATAPAAVSAPR
jgi:hypothetical protein